MHSQDHRHYNAVEIESTSDHQVVGTWEVITAKEGFCSYNDCLQD